MALLTVIRGTSVSRFTTEVIYSELETLPRAGVIEMNVGDAIILNGIVYASITGCRYLDITCYVEIRDMHLLPIPSRMLESLFECAFEKGWRNIKIHEMPEARQCQGYLRIHRVF